MNKAELDSYIEKLEAVQPTLCIKCQALVEEMLQGFRDQRKQIVRETLQYKGLLKNMRPSKTPLEESEGTPT